MTSLEEDITGHMMAKETEEIKELVHKMMEFMHTTGMVEYCIPCSNQSDPCSNQSDPCSNQSDPEKGCQSMLGGPRFQCANGKSVCETCFDCAIRAVLEHDRRRIIPDSSNTNPGAAEVRLYRELSPLVEFNVGDNDSLETIVNIAMRTNILKRLEIVTAIMQNNHDGSPLRPQ
jgi:hypothetical protein